MPHSLPIIQRPPGLLPLGWTTESQGTASSADTNLLPSCSLQWIPFRPEHLPLTGTGVLKSDASTAAAPRLRRTTEMLTLGLQELRGQATVK